MSPRETSRLPAFADLHVASTLLSCSQTYTAALLTSLTAFATCSHDAFTDLMQAFWEWSTPIQLKRPLLHILRNVEATTKLQLRHLELWQIMYRGHAGRKCIRDGADAACRVSYIKDARL